MAFVDPSLISDPKEQKWVGEISEILKHQLEIKVEIPPVSIFKIPKTITTEKPEAYKPKQIGFGPYHHFHPVPYTKMEQKKLLVLQNVLQHHKIKDFRLNVLDKVEKLVPVIRACYEMFLPDDNNSMALVFAIDGLFLLNLFETYDNNQVKVDPTKRFLAQDILKVENQIPFMVLKEINEALHTSSEEEMLVDQRIIASTSSKTHSLEELHRVFDQQSHTSLTFSPSIFRSFSEIHSPLELSSQSQAPDHVEHLLHYMYHSIINNGTTKNIHLPISSTKPSAEKENVPFMKMFNYMNNASIINNGTTSLQNSTQHKLTIPSASKLQRKVGFEFRDLPKDEGVENVYMNENKMIYLPRITLNNDSEVILRNLVAYETLMHDASNHFPLTGYMYLMCGLIVNTEDVKLLKKKNIIKGELGDEEVANIFVEMSSSILSLKTEENSMFQDMIDNVNKIYEKRRRNIEDCGSFLVKKVGSFAGDTLKIVALMVGIVIVFMLTYQAYCDVFGCDKRSATLLFSY